MLFIKGPLDSDGASPEEIQCEDVVLVERHPKYPWEVSITRVTLTEMWNWGGFVGVRAVMSNLFGKNRTELVHKSWEEAREWRDKMFT